MKKLLFLCLAVAAAFWGAGCASCDVDEPMYIQVRSGPDLNSYSGTAHALVLYIYKLMEPGAFMAADVEDLMDPRPQIQGVVPLTQPQSIMPGNNPRITLAPRGQEFYGYLGVVAGYQEPTGPRRMTVEIGSCEFVLSLGSNGINSFEED